MRKIILTVVFIVCLVSTSYAGFNFGTDTYEKVDDILIVNSLGDQTVESIFKHDGKNLGYNDFIPENAFKNDLYNQGYSVVYDYDDAGLDLVEVGYMGVRGDPRSYDADYVLRKEYEKYSSQYQDERIDSNKTNISNNASKIISVDKKHTIWNDKQDARLDGIDVTNAYQDMRLDANKNNILINRDKINDNAVEISNVDSKHTDWNNTQDSKINNNKSNIDNNAQNINTNANNISSNSNRINDLDNRVGDLEQTQYVVGGAIRIIDSKKWNVELFADFSTNRQMVDRTGIRFTYKFGESYTDKKIRELEERLDNLEL